MQRLLIEGGRPLYGCVPISGMKNSAVAVLYATVLIKEECIIENIPKIMDVYTVIESLKSLGAVVEWISEDTISVNCRTLRDTHVPECWICGIRASYYLLGGLLGRFGYCEIAYPGGCDFGKRPIDQHMRAFSAFGADCEQEKGYIKVEAKEALHGATITFDVISVGATVNALLVASSIVQETVLEQVAIEPHVQDLMKFLCACGVKIKLEGRTLRIRGGEQLHGCRFRISPDMIEAGTFLIAATACGGDVCCTALEPSHLSALCKVLSKMGANIDLASTQIRIRREGTVYATSVTTGAYPAFPTDLQPQIGVLMSIAHGESRLYEKVWSDRFRYLPELQKMGAVVKQEGDCAIFNGTRLYGAPVEATDLRAGAALVIAGLCAQGKTQISNLAYIERGYVALSEKLKNIGANIEKSG